MSVLVLILARSLLTPALLLLALARRRVPLTRLSLSPRLAVLAVGVVAFAAGALLSWLRPPVPHIHDEFSQLLGADTFARGRAANPTHPMWVHFETFHVLHEPAYASKYPPAPMLLMALGQAVAGSPLVGVAFAGAAITWMLQAFVPPRWAFWGGLLAAFHFSWYGAAAPGMSPLGYWSQSF